MEDEFHLNHSISVNPDSLISSILNNSVEEVRPSHILVLKLWDCLKDSDELVVLICTF